MYQTEDREGTCYRCSTKFTYQVYLNEFVKEIAGRNPKPIGTPVPGPAQTQHYCPTCMGRSATKETNQEVSE